ncbi:Secreted protein containing DUF481 [Planctomycetales bacterium 10988]|nr:Secreted protein containing DUF481 [Planctomycetales bacterium 10988]
MLFTKAERISALIAIITGLPCLSSFAQEVAGPQIVPPSTSVSPGTGSYPPLSRYPNSPVTKSPVIQSPASSLPTTSEDSQGTTPQTVQAPYTLGELPPEAVTESAIVPTSYPQTSGVKFSPYVVGQPEEVSPGPTFTQPYPSPADAVGPRYPTYEGQNGVYYEEETPSSTAPQAQATPNQPKIESELVPPGKQADIPQFPGEEVIGEEMIGQEFIVGETGPVVHEPTFFEMYSPRNWIHPCWDASFELGINGSQGNAESFSTKAGVDVTRKTEKHKLTGKVSYSNTRSRSITTQDNALGKGRYERLFKDSPWSFFTTGTVEYDQFKAFDYRTAGNLGLGYQFICTPITKLTGRFGSGVSREFGGPDDEWTLEGLLGADFEHKLGDRQCFKVTVDYFPEVEELTDFRLVTDAGWEILLDEATNLSLKIGIIDRYDSTPNGREPNDLDYSLLLLWKL